MTHENNENTKDLEHEPPVTRNVRVILEQFTLRAPDVGCNVKCIGINPLNRLTLFCYHVCELVENLTQFRNCGLNRLDGGGARLDVTVLQEQVRMICFEILETSRPAYLLLYELHLLKCTTATIWHATLSMFEVKGEHAIVWCCSSLAFCIKPPRGTITHGILSLCARK